ncbi:unnamed protein product [Bursaphelenchus okinawaensis]|uniref:J domain-containing protein n=1 Tax=Bursaphelenchus okinawaensis TaxID=465554 RepID=A0A811KTE0_9BILA|nr:unnamed protein product [Bursaphelenchus okinawaensis]CAG9109855.1 unnamed protein product [Bursaphelenchus okinawaensis]
MLDFYTLFAIDQSAPASEIKSAYHKFLLKVHPDKNLDKPQTEQEYRAVNLAQQAYSTLRNPSLRKTYDLWLREQRLREERELISEEFELEKDETSLETECRCGAIFEIEESELANVLDYALFECSNCSLCFKVSTSQRHG